MHISLPSPDSRTLAGLPADARQEVRTWLHAFSSVPFSKPVGQWLEQVAALAGKSPKTARRKYDAYRTEQSWHVFIPRHKCPRPATQVRTRYKAFRTHLLTLAEKHQRNSTAGIRTLKRQWQNRETIPGYEDFPGWPSTPHGWTKRNLTRIITVEADERQLTAIRRGTSSKTNFGLAQVHTTRVGLYPGAVYQFDDVWHDHFVLVGKDRTPTRVLELGVLDLFSACRFHWGAKPRMQRADGTHENLKEKEMRFFLAAVLSNYGYSERGTQLMVEHGTAAIREDVARTLHDDTRGLISVERQPIEGKQQALSNYWKGSEGGNFRAKAALESLHNLIHNDLAALDLQAGMNRDSRPLTTDRQLHYITKTVKEAAQKDPRLIELLHLPGMDFHTEFIPWLNTYYRECLNTRTDHELEGWKQLGFLRTEYTTAPGSEHFLTAEQFLALPDASRHAISTAAQSDPKTWTRRRQLSPAEVYYPAVNGLHKIAPHTLCDILSQDLAREVTVRGSFIEFSDIDIAPEPMIYESRLLTLDGSYRELPSKGKFNAFANPFAPRWLFLTDARGTCLGRCELVKRVTSTDSDALHRAAGHKASRNADILQPLRIRHAETSQDAQDLREHNRRLIAGEETDPAERRAAAAEKSANTRRKTRLDHQDPGLATSLADLTGPLSEPEPYDDTTETSLSDLL